MWIKFPTANAWVVTLVMIAGCSSSSESPTKSADAAPAVAQKTSTTQSEPIRVHPDAPSPVTPVDPAKQPPNALPAAVVNPMPVEPVATKVAATEATPALPGAHQAVYNVPQPVVDEMIRRNGKVFDGWPKPQAALLITGEQWGYFEPCGCAGLENQKGGMSRRYTFLKQMREQGWNIAPIDVGGMIKRFGRQQEIKFQVSIEALRQMGYRAIGWGPGELRLSTGEVVAAIAEPDGSPCRFISANVGLFGADSGLTPKYTVIELGGRKIGVTSVLADSLHSQINNSDLTFTPAEQALTAILPELKSKADVLVLLSHGTPDETRKLAAKFPDFRFVVTAGGADEPRFEPEQLTGPNQILIDVGHKAMYGVVLGLYDDAQTPVRYQRLPFDARFADSPEMHKLKASYQLQLQQVGWQGLGIEPKPHPRAADAKDPLGQFVGSEKCGECHSTAFDIWKGTPHAHGTETLVKLDPVRHFDAECVSCHVTGWSPQEFFPYTSGFLSLEKTPQLVSVGCENCHGPGAAHVAAESGDAAGPVNPLRPNAGGGNRDKLREAMRVPLGTKANNVCSKCHDLDNSPAFELMKYWERIVHKGKD